MSKLLLRSGLCPGPRCGAYSAPPQLLAEFRLADWLFVTFVCSIETSEHILELCFSFSRIPTILVFLLTLCFGEIPTGSLLTGASNTGGV